MARTTKSTPDGIDVTTGEAREDAAVETSPDQPAPLVAVAAGDTATDPAGQALADVTIDVKPQNEVAASQGQGPAVADVAAAASVLADAASKAGTVTPFEPQSDADVPDSGDVELVMIVGISGLRNGEPWPRPGGKITLPADEAAQCVANGYAALAE